MAAYRAGRVGDGVVGQVAGCCTTAGWAGERVARSEAVPEMAEERVAVVWWPYAADRRPQRLLGAPECVAARGSRQARAAGN
jgi:hypothetical protein